MRLPPRRSTALGPASAAALLAASLACSAPAAIAAEQWLKVSTADFELFTPWGEKDARAAILHFQQIQGFFVGSTAAKSSASARVRVIVFRSEKEFKPYRPNEVAAAFYTGSNSRDYIVMKDIGSESYSAAVHEYFHLWVKNSHLPLWLNEGLADFYSTLAPMGDKVLIGEFPPGRFQTLQQEKAIPLNTLLAVDAHSAFYNEKDRAGSFYSQSWALVHMLNLSTTYRTNFFDFYKAIVSGASAVDALQQVYGKTPAEVEKDLQQYIHGANMFKGALVPRKLEKATDKPEVHIASALESGMVLADLAATTRGKEADAQAAYEKLAGEFPQSWEVEAALARIAWRTRDLEQARNHFSRAVKLDSSDAQVFLDYSRLLRQANEPPSTVVPLLSRAVELNPDLAEAHYDLGYALFAEKKYSEAIEHLRKVPQIPREQAVAYFRALAYAHYQLNELEAARQDGERARQYATATNEILETEKFLAAVQHAAEPRPAASASTAEAADSIHPALQGAPEGTPKKEPGKLLRRDDADSPVEEVPGPFFKPPILLAEGILQSVDCLGKSARIRVLVAGKPVAFALVDPATVEIKGSGGTIDFSCGKQQPIKIVIGYVLEDNRQLGTVGNVRSMEIK